MFEELSKYGDIESLNVCDNLADHIVWFFVFCFDSCDRGLVLMFGGDDLLW